MTSILKMGVNYTGKFVLAPMVRVGELPTRLLALKYGADLVWGPEIIDKKILTFKRVENKDLGTVDFITSREGQGKKAGVENVSFRTHRETEKDKLIFQLGTADPDLAVKAANIIIDDVDGLDINAGCPKHFSIHAGMGAALLRTPDLLCEILERLVKEVGKPKNKPISVKIRILETKEETLDLVDKLLKTGISNLTVHCRTREMRNRQSPIRDYLPFIIPKCKEHNVSFIINGAIRSYQEYKDLQKEYGEDIGAMVAEAAESNPTVFSETPLHWAKAAKEFNQYSNQFNHHVGNTKFCLSRIIPGKAKVYQQISRAKTQEDLNTAFNNLRDDGLLENFNKEEHKTKKTSNVEKIQAKPEVQKKGVEEKEGEEEEKGVDGSNKKRAIEESAELEVTVESKKLKIDESLVSHSVASTSTKA